MGHVAHTRERRDAYRVLVGKPEGMDFLEELSIDSRIITIKPVVKKQDENVAGLMWLRTGKGIGFL